MNNIKYQNFLCLLAHPDTKVHLRGFIATAAEWFQSLNVEPDIVSITAPGFPRKDVSYAKAKTKLMEPTLEQANHGTIMKMAPEYKTMSDYVVKTGFLMRYKSFDFAVSPNFTMMTDLDWIALAKKAHSSLRFVYGYTFTLPLDVGPGYYAEGVGYRSDGKSHESELRGCWGRASENPEDNPRDRILRQIYSLQFLSPGHLDLQIQGMSLKDWILTSPSRGKLEPLIGDMWSWSFSNDRDIYYVNLALFEAGLLVAWDPALVEDPLNPGVPLLKDFDGRLVAPKSPPPKKPNTISLPVINALSNADLADEADLLFMALMEIARLPEGNYLSMVTGKLQHLLRSLAHVSNHTPDFEGLELWRDSESEPIRKGYQKLLESTKKYGYEQEGLT